ncbi:MAG: glutamate 5-kinase [Clostridia bacterium]|nr:glutamate 5-kinase [Clostridia bacterium]
MDFKDFKKIVIKVGSSTLTYDNGRPNLRRIEQLCRVVSDLKNRGIDVILVSSGAIAVGVNRLRLPARPKDTKGKQAAAAVGQCDLMSIYDRSFAEYGYVSAQILLNRDVIDHEDRKINVINTFNTLLEYDAIPIVNENDSVSVEEILFGDNDNLSAIVAALVEAQGLIILTDIDGYYDDNPRENPDARLIHEVNEITDEMIENAGGNGTSRGTGGMRTKLEAAKFAASHNIQTIIMSGDDPKKIFDVFDGYSIGTVFKVK